jgi:hypothetical protein
MTQVMTQVGRSESKAIHERALTISLTRWSMHPRWSVVARGLYNPSVQLYSRGARVYAGVMSRHRRHHKHHPVRS